MKRLERHVEKTLDHMQSDPEERAELREELLAHLKSLKEEFLAQGHSEKKAEQKAVEEFGGPKLVGNGLQESMYPYQRGLLFVIGLGTILFGILLHFVFIMNAEEPGTDWLLVQMALGTVVSLAAFNVSWIGRFYWSINVLIYLTAGWNGFNYFVVIRFRAEQSIPLLLYIAVLVVISFLFMVRNASFFTNRGDPSKKKRRIKTASHIINLLLGLAISAAALFVTWAGLAFSEYSWKLFLPLTAIVGWLIFYKFQMRFIGKKPVAAIFTGLLFVCVVIAVPMVPIVFG
ncbi:permease prefix domain 1-containing protein [Halobacillus litoralis]|uniref:permease prefix domain 1-containing protein n=1 Tax=Halobacillus litoralis TaxID=45668 RepID=UPI001CD1A0D3|nr:permease prefix domain 1-containing protein [Halobacillus litoralis]MCA0972062.1 permease prefix domain 1-containing protein [Halobacillus litoralis]